MAAGSKKVIYAALIGNALIAVTKFVASGFTGSSAMLSEGIHSVVDTGNQALLLFGLKQAKKPPSAQFPLGHGKEIYFWSFVVAILIFAVGSGVSIYEGIQHLLDPHPVKNPMVNYIVLGLAIIFEGSAFAMAVKEFRKAKGNLGYFEAVKRGKDPSLFTVLFEDAAAMTGLVIALVGLLLGQLTGIVYFDGAASVMIGLVLAATAIWLAMETKSLLIGEAASPQVIKAIREIAAAPDEIYHVNEVITMHMGPEYILVNLSVKFSDETSASDIEKAAAKVDSRIKKAFPEVKRVFIEAEEWAGKPPPDSTTHV